MLGSSPRSVTSADFDGDGKPDLAVANTGSRNVSILKNISNWPSCCAGLTGNVDCSSDDVSDVSDLAALIDYLFISLTPLCCPSEGNTEGSLDGVADVSDLIRLIDYLFITLAPTAACQRDSREWCNREMGGVVGRSRNEQRTEIAASLRSSQRLIGNVTPAKARGSIIY